MKLVYTHENLFLVAHARGLLHKAGIDTLLKNEYAGGGRGELPVFETWPELWVSNEADHERAQALIAEMDEPDRQDEWGCPCCGESNHGAFEVCWRCATERGTGRPG